MTRFAIIMSVEKYQNFQPTNFTHADSNLIYRTLTQKCDYAEQHAALFQLSPEEIKSPSDILTEIKSTVKNSKVGDSILFYFAGHGHFSEGKTYLILPNTTNGAFETTALALDDISNELRLDNRNCFRLFDACHSGVDVRDGENQPNSHDFIRSINQDGSGWVTIAACKENQYSISAPQLGHGLFTYYLCAEIEKVEIDEPILPEILKVRIADKILEESKKLGYTQTPTLNASISGNISIATRRANSLPDPAVKAKKDDQNKELKLRIAKLNETPDILSNENLEKVLNIITEQIVSDFEKLNVFDFDISMGEKIVANEIPEEMHPGIVDFSKSSALQPRHDLIRHEEYDEPYFTRWEQALASVYSRKRKKTVHYFLSQPKEMPPSASIIKLKGDGRCIPNIEILVYLIPLQITGCMLASGFNCGWTGDEEIDLIKNYYQMLQPEDSHDRIKEFGPFVADKVMTKITNIVQKRIDLLERELKA